MQTAYDENSYEKFITNIESFLMNQNNESYHYQHDNFLTEADANIYGVRKAKEYLKKKKPDLYEKEKDRIEEIEKNTI